MKQVKRHELISNEIVSGTSVSSNNKTGTLYRAESPCGEHPDDKYPYDVNVVNDEENEMDQIYVADINGEPAIKEGDYIVFANPDEARYNYEIYIVTPI